MIMFGMGGFNPAMLQNIMGAGRFGGLGGMQGGGYSGMGGNMMQPSMIGGLQNSGQGILGGMGQQGGVGQQIGQGQDPRMEQMANRLRGMVGGGQGGTESPNSGNRRARMY
jgi:hypothetical protein